VEKRESSGSEYGAEQGLHHSPEEAAEALDMLFRLRRGDLSALAPKIHCHHPRGGMYEAIRKAGANRRTIQDAKYFMRYGL
jgi:hypothetical protein